MSEEIWTVGRLLKWTEEYFSKAGIDTPRLDAEVLLCHVLKKERIFLYVHFDQPVMKDELAEFKECIKKRVQHMPVAYITGHREFMSLDFKVTEDTLIPRPDTEILVESVIERLKPSEKGGIIADIGTGTGAIMLSLLNYLPRLRGVAVDISPKALEVARENAEKLKLSDRVELLLGDMLTPVSGRVFDAIVSNPPYIPKEDLQGLQLDVRKFEPMSALDGGQDGLDYYRILLKEAAGLLSDGGFLALEVGIYQAQQLKELAQKSQLWNRTEIIRDLAGTERVVVLWKERNESN